MAVTIDIPGIGNVEAKNAASESTLREILKVMQGVQSNTKQKTGTGSGNQGGNTGGGGSTPTGFFGSLGKAAGTAKTALGGLSSKLALVEGGFARFNQAITGTIDSYAGVGNSMERAAKVIPIFGGMLSTVAGSANKLNDAFLDAAKTGANFGDDVNAFARSASAAGMTLDNFGRFIASNSEGLIGLGGTVGEGVDNFTRVSKTLRATGSSLYALGYTTEDINKGIANYGALLRIQGRQGTMNNEQLAAASRNYMKEMDALAKATGEERASLEAKMKQMAQDAQFSSFMSTKSADVQNSFNALITRMGPTLGNFAKDFITTGTLTSDQTRKIGSMYGQQALDELMRLRQKALANQKATAEDSDRAVGVMIREGKRVQQQFGETLAASSGEFDDVAKANIDSNKLQADAMKKANDEQDKSVQAGKKFNESIQRIQERLSAFSNKFVEVLATSGLLDTLMAGFEMMANLVMTFIVPVFNLLAGAVKILGYVVENFVLPVFRTLGDVVDSVTAFVEDNFQAIGLALGTFGAMMAVANAGTVVKTAVTMAETAAVIAKTVATLALLGPLALLALGMAALTSPLGLAVIAIGALTLIFKKLYDSGWTFGSVLEAMGDNLKRFGLFYTDIWLAIAEKIAGFFGKGDTIKAARQRIAEEQAELDEREAARDEKRKVVADERQAQKDKNALAREEKKHGEKTLADKKKIAEETSKIDTNAGPEELLKQFAKAEGSPLIPKDKTEAAAKAETTKKEIENKAEEQAKAAEKAKEEIKKESESKPAAPTQESAESLLAQLNSNMARLIRIASEQKDIGERQLGVQRSLSGDLFAA